MNKFISQSKKFFLEPQSSVLSAATIIMLMIVASRVLGLVRQRVLAHFFSPSELALFFAAFRLPDLVFEVLVFGTFSSAFIPVFTKSIKKGQAAAWETASTVVNLGLLLFSVFALLVGLSADSLYGIFAPGFAPEDQRRIVEMTRILFAAQGFFVVSYILTGVLESLRRFLIPALAPLFYNIGIMTGTILLSAQFGLFAPAIGVLLGAVLHFLVQLPLAFKLGFRYRPSINISDDVKKIGRLALPRVIEVSFMQIAKTAELFFASIISTASYTYFTLGNSLQLLPVGLFGTSIAKAALPTLARQANSPHKFKKTLLSALYQVVFLSLPIATILIVLRIPIIRLAFGTDIFGWEATVQTGYVLSAFAAGIIFQAASALLARSFYALHDTKTPVFISIGIILLTIILDYVFVLSMGLSVWSLALGFTIGSSFQTMALFYLLNKKVLKESFGFLLAPLFRLLLAATASGSTMYLLLKVFDRSVWIKRLSFLGRIESARYFPFQRFVLDTRYTANVLVLTVLVSLIGIAVYILILFLLRSKELWDFIYLVKGMFTKYKVTSIPEKEEEPVAPTPGGTTS